MKGADFARRVAIVTGGGRGIGRETARLLIEQGAAVVINGRDESRLKQVAAELNHAAATRPSMASSSTEGATTTAPTTVTTENRIAISVGDVADETNARAVVACALENFGRLDMLINNAGLSMRGDFAETTPLVVERMIRANYLSAATMSRCAIEPLRQTRGSILFVSSIAGLYGFPGVVAYSATKMALTALQQGLDAELIHDAIHVGIVYVSFTENDPDKRISLPSGRTETVKRPFLHTQRQVAASLLSAIVHRRPITVLSRRGALLYHALRFAPALVRRFARRSNLHRR